MSQRFLYHGVDEDVVRGHWDAVLGLLEDMHRLCDRQPPITSPPLVTSSLDNPPTTVNYLALPKYPIKESLMDYEQLPYLGINANGVRKVAENTFKGPPQPSSSPPSTRLFSKVDLTNEVSPSAQVVKATRADYQPVTSSATANLNHEINYHSNIQPSMSTSSPAASVNEGSGITTRPIDVRLSEGSLMQFIPENTGRIDNNYRGHLDLLPRNTFDFNLLSSEGEDNEVDTKDIAEDVSTADEVKVKDIQPAFITRKRRSNESVAAIVDATKPVSDIIPGEFFC
jgi:hypothetical protein